MWLFVIDIFTTPQYGYVYHVFNGTGTIEIIDCSIPHY